MHWGVCNEFNKLFILQKRAVRIIASLNRLQSCKESFKNLKMLTLPCIYIYETVCFVYKNKHIFTANHIDRRYDTRKKDYLLPKKHETASFRKNSYFTGCKFFNALPDNVKAQPNLNRFKYKVKKLLIKAYYNVNEILSDVF